MKDCPNPHNSSLNSKRGGKERQYPPCYQQEGNWNFNSGRGHFNRRTTDPRGWARTGTEPETLVYLNFVPCDAILDVGSSISLISVLGLIEVEYEFFV